MAACLGLCPDTTLSCCHVALGKTVVRLKCIISRKVLKICLAHNKCSININESYYFDIIFKCFLSHNFNKAILLLKILQWFLAFPLNCKFLSMANRLFQGWPLPTHPLPRLSDQILSSVLRIRVL